ncbi:alginate O-acetyltransferase [Desulfosporosinus sp. HMP52]|uniref:MBOAT family O-acyltransferase n=1 Tax=Desulfosporosinus sp. HMP52 TaxID=1487923 RepID=UPI00051FC834|nr:MBOAT family O-acyltransferase [Desulfosporosinus sp. HMP52]KGK87234.1 alginate O-acetyltransferase [Desulfosporosinus sp. HMP52]
MLFNSYAFIFVFLPTTMVVFFLLARQRLLSLATGILVLASIIFYAYWDIRNLPILITSMVFNFFAGRLLQARRRQLILIIAIAVNLLTLGYYKYVGFIVDNLNDVFHAGISIPQIILPLGISFFTFTQIAYLVDAYRGETKGYDFLTYSLFVTFFPHLIAGPILYHKDIIPQFKSLRSKIFSHENISIGLSIFIMGLGKKVIIADHLIGWVTPVFNHPGDISFLEAWAGAIAYTLQLYFDFSGYSEMALGLGKMFNIELPVNFLSPYKSTSIIEFWRRWHISLSSFLKNYLYIPLGGNRKGDTRRLLNLWLTMLIGGIWHGAGWTFFIWGGLHGTFLVINHQWRKLKIPLPKVLAWPITFMAVVFAWVFFRANSVHTALEIVQGMVGLNKVIFPDAFLNGFSRLPLIPGGSIELLLLGALVLFVGLMPNVPEIIARFRPSIRWALMAGLLFTICLLQLGQVSEFLYFQF